MEDRFKVGIITSTHGLKGEVKVFPTTDDVKRFKKLKMVTLDNGKMNVELEVESVKFFKQFVILKFKDINDINDVEKYRKFELYVDREHAVKLEKNEYFIADLFGLAVYDTDGKLVGQISDVITTGANDVYEIKVDDEFLYNGVKVENKSFLLPAIKECVLDVDIAMGRMTINILKGLIG